MPTHIYPTLPPSYQLLSNAEGPGQYNGGFDASGRADVLTFRVPFEDAEAFYAACVGTDTTVVVGGVSVTRKIPLQCAWGSKLYARRVSYRGVGSDAAVSEARPYSHVDISVEFGPLGYDPTGAAPYLSIRYRGTSEQITVPGGGTYAFANGEKIDHDVGVWCGSVALEITRYQVPDLTAWLTLCASRKGKVNGDTVTLDGFTYPPKSLLYPTFDAAKTASTSGELQASATIVLLQRDILWTSGVRSDGVVDAITPAPYVTTTFMDMFAP